MLVEISLLIICVAYFVFVRDTFIVLLHSYCTITALSLLHHCTITIVSLYYHYTVYTLYPVKKLTFDQFVMVNPTS